MNYDLIETFEVSPDSAKKLMQSLPESGRRYAEYKNGNFSVEADLDEDDIRNFCETYSQVMNDENDNEARSIVVSGEYGRWALVVTRNCVYDYDLETLAELASKEILRTEHASEKNFQPEM